VERLPASHRRLLRYLLVVLRRVCDHSARNEMTSYNVAACIAQCLLWPPDTADVPTMSADDRLSAAKRLNCVVQKMIDAAHEIFGADPPPFISSQLGKQLRACFFVSVQRCSSAFVRAQRYASARIGLLESDSIHPFR